MGLELPNPGNVFIPAVPDAILKDNPALGVFLRDFRKAVEDGVRDQFSNNLHIATAVNLGISGTFAISSGGSIVVTSGIVINVTS